MTDENLTVDEARRRERRRVIKIIEKRAEEIALDGVENTLSPKYACLNELGHIRREVGD